MIYIQRYIHTVKSHITLSNDHFIIFIFSRIYLLYFFIYLVKIYYFKRPINDIYYFYSL